MKTAWKQKHSKPLKFLYFVPLLAFLFLFKLWPFLQILIVSFKEEYNFLTQNYSGIGVENYITVLTDEYFLQATWNTFLYTIAVLFFSNLIALPVAWCLYRAERFSSLFQTAIFLPFVTSNIAIGMAWRIIFNEKGVLNSMLNGFGLPSLHWLSDSTLSLPTLILYGVWSTIPFTILLYLSYLLSLDKTLLISAAVDGASEGKMFVKIVLPSMVPTILMTTILNGISTWLEINALFPLFSGNPGPYYDLYTVVYYIYSKMQKGTYSLGIASAASMLLFLCIGVFLCLRTFLRPKAIRSPKEHSHSKEKI